MTMGKRLILAGAVVAIISMLIPSIAGAIPATVITAAILLVNFTLLCLSAMCF